MTSTQLNRSAKYTAPSNCRSTFVEESDDFFVGCVQEYNAQVLIPRAERLQRGCAAAHSTAVLSVEAWSKARPLPGNAYKPSCTIEDQLKLQRLTNDLQVEKAETYGLIEKYAGESSAIINLLADQIEARSKYDTEYLYNKTVAGLTSEKFRIQRVANLSLQARKQTPT
eukprot:1330839-Pleurochrysis_carterae.AAC.5